MPAIRVGLPQLRGSPQDAVAAHLLRNRRIREFDKLKDGLSIVIATAINNGENPDQWIALQTGVNAAVGRIMRQERAAFWLDSAEESADRLAERYMSNEERRIAAQLRESFEAEREAAAAAEAQRLAAQAADVAEAVLEAAAT